MDGVLDGVLDGCSVGSGGEVGRGGGMTGPESGKGATWNYT